MSTLLSTRTVRIVLAPAASTTQITLSTMIASRPVVQAIFFLVYSTIPQLRFASFVCYERALHCVLAYGLELCRSTSLRIRPPNFPDTKRHRIKETVEVYFLGFRLLDSPHLASFQLLATQLSPNNPKLQPVCLLRHGCLGSFLDRLSWCCAST